jgi:uncharacterized protein YjiS (DUF1127 family)
MNELNLTTLKSGKAIVGVAETEVLAAPLRGSLLMALASIGWIVCVIDTLLLWLERHRQRRALDGLNDHVLKDIGLSRADVHGEVRRRFWHG